MNKTSLMEYVENCTLLVKESKKGSSLMGNCRAMEEASIGIIFMLETLYKVEERVKEQKNSDMAQHMWVPGKKT